MHFLMLYIKNYKYKLFILSCGTIKTKYKWGLGIGDWAQSPIPNPQSPIPNPQSPFMFFFYSFTT